MMTKHGHDMTFPHPPFVVTKVLIKMLLKNSSLFVGRGPRRYVEEAGIPLETKQTFAALQKQQSDC